MTQMQRNEPPYTRARHRKRIYQIFDLRGRTKLTEVEAVDLSDAAEQVAKHWPCRMKADHLPYPYVEVEPDGTLSLEPHKVPEVKPSKRPYKRR